MSLLCSGLSVLLGPEWLPVRVGVNHEWICSLSFCGFCTSRHCELPSVHTLLSNHKATETPRRPSRLTWMVPREQVASDAPGAPGGGETSSPAATPCELQGELMAECVADMPVTIAPFCMGGMIWVAYSWLHSPLHPCLFLGLPGGSSGAKNLPSKLVWCVSANPCRPSSQPTVSVAATRHPCRGSCSGGAPPVGGVASSVPSHQTHDRGACAQRFRGHVQQPASRGREVPCRPGRAGTTVGFGPHRPSPWQVGARPACCSPSFLHPPLIRKRSQTS